MWGCSSDGESVGDEGRAAQLIARGTTTPKERRFESGHPRQSPTRANDNKGGYTMDNCKKNYRIIVEPISEEAQDLPDDLKSGIECSACGFW